MSNPAQEWRYKSKATKNRGFTKKSGEQTKKMWDTPTFWITNGVFWMSIHIQTYSNHQTYLEEFQWTKWILYMSVFFWVYTTRPRGYSFWPYIISIHLISQETWYSPFFTCHKNYTLCSGDDHVDYDAKLAWNPWPALAWNLPRWGWRFNWGIVSFCSWWMLMGVIYSTCFFVFFIFQSRACFGVVTIRSLGDIYF